MGSSNFLDSEDAVRRLPGHPEQADLARAAYFHQLKSMPARRYHGSAELRRNLPKQLGRAFDLGVGNGTLSLASAADGWQVTAVEPDPSALTGTDAIRAPARNTGTRIDVVEAGHLVSFICEKEDRDVG
ncbi:hypothetical protein NKJ36_26275 [Mesorhizobium sp. M0142]|nr:hypothetical protein [Mesorhizobium sp. LSHC420B00]ESX80261.1 hypothetical protein X759_13960 [Mesorhizobium sp. LSHC420B00]